MIKITAETLRAAGACSEGVDAFLSLLPDGFRSESWGKGQQVGLLLSPLRQYWGWAVGVGLIPAWSMHGANLHGANLRGADLRGADLYGADLRDANLRGADLYGADLRDANLRGANLRGANLRDANMRYAIGVER